MCELCIGKFGCVVCVVCYFEYVVDMVEWLFC